MTFLTFRFDFSLINLFCVLYLLLIQPYLINSAISKLESHFFSPKLLFFLIISLAFSEQIAKSKICEPERVYLPLSHRYLTSAHHVFKTVSQKHRYDRLVNSTIGGNPLGIRMSTIGEDVGFLIIVIFRNGYQSVQPGQTDMKATGVLLLILRKNLSFIPVQNKYCFLWLSRREFQPMLLSFHIYHFFAEFSLVRRFDCRQFNCTVFTSIQPLWNINMTWQ